MIHAILEDMLTPAQAREHLRVIDEHLTGPDGLRLFDRPMPYHGGPQRFFQRAESATFFGREIGLMYMHAHLRYAQALARVGDAEGFFRALRQANPIGLRELTPAATLRQANCYYSSSDAAFADRYEASAQYERVSRGEIPLDGGWRIYSSGAGIAMSLLVRRFLGVAQDHDALIVDPVIPSSLSGLSAALTIYGRPVEIAYEVHAPGCGVRSVEVNGVVQKLSYESNPYRTGAARIEKVELLASLREGANVMCIAIGQA
jgi:cellobiose phosphorylase